MKIKRMTGAALLAGFALSGCGALELVGVDSDVRNARVQPIDYGPITTYPIVTDQKVPAGMTPTGSTGYAVANSARTNGTIVNGTAAQCGAENVGGNYDIACAQAAGLPGTVTPYIR